MKITAIITAGGTGSRFSSSGKPKQFYSLNSLPMILYSMLAFQNSGAVNEIFVTAGKEYFDFLHKISFRNGISKLTRLVEGGKTRFRSVKNAFMQIEGLPDDIIIIHDAVRPNINASFIRRLISELRSSDGLVPGLKITETVKKAKNYVIKDTVDRKNLFTVQTPQLFRYKALKKSYSKCRNRNDFTDEAALVECAGFKVKITEGKKDNIKITTPEDIKILKAFWNK